MSLGIPCCECMGACRGGKGGGRLRLATCSGTCTAYNDIRSDTCTRIRYPCRNPHDKAKPAGCAWHHLVRSSCLNKHADLCEESGRAAHVKQMHMGCVCLQDLLKGGRSRSSKDERHSSETPAAPSINKFCEKNFPVTAIC